MRSLFALTWALNALGAVETAHAQRRPISAAQVMNNLRVHGDPGAAAAILRQRGVPRSPELRDSIADSLTAFVLSYRPDGPVSLEAAQAARRALVNAGAIDGVGTPYDGALARLKRLVESAHPQLRPGALLAISQIATPGEALRYLEGVAVSDNGPAYEAVDILGRRMGAQGVAVIRRLYSERSVRQKYARRDVVAIAKAYGWNAPQ